MSEWLAPEDLHENSVLSTDEVAPGTRLGRYEIVLPIASGGMARVWAARMQGQRGFSKLVAVKTILPHLALDPEFERMFLDEARIAAGVHHPNVCEIHELGEEGSVLYLAMEWVNGDSLYQLLRAESTATPRPEEPRAPLSPLEPRIAARLIADACAGLHAAHNQEGDDGKLLGVVHRDVSPQNVLVTIDGNAKVADFGVAKALGQAHGTSSGQLRGKLHYMSPEQISGAEIDRRSDVFALGCVLYEATTGWRAFEGDADHLVMQSTLAGRFVPPSQRRLDFPQGLEQIIARALAPHPAQRFPSAERMRIALEQWLAKSGSLVVTQSDVARVVRARLGPKLERRKERLRQAIAAMGETDALSDRPARSPSHSGVKPMGAAGLRYAPDSTPPPRISAPPPAPWTSSPPPRLESPPPESFDRAIGHGYATPPPAAVAAAQVGFDLTDPKIPTLPLPPRGMSPDSTGSASTLVKQKTAAAPWLAGLSVGACIFLGVAAAGAIGWRALASPADAPVPPVAAPAAAPHVEPSPEPLAELVQPIAFVVSPASAEIVIDGAALPDGADGARSVARPREGHPLTVYVRAPGFEDEVLTVDHLAPSTVEVVLTATAPKAKGPAPTDHPKAQSLPANPY